MRRSIIIICAFVLVFNATWAQVGINTTTFDGSAVLEAPSSVHGVLFPSMRPSERDLILNPAKGLIIYNNISNALDYNQGTPGAPSWLTVASQIPVTSYNKQSVKYTNTDITTNVNNSIALPVFGAEEWNDNNSLFVVSGNTITITEAGRYKVNANVSLISNSNNARKAMEMYLTVGGTQVGSFSATSYIRRSGNGILHEVASLHLNETITVAANSILSITIVRTGNAGSTLLRSVGSSNFYLEKID